MTTTPSAAERPAYAERLWSGPLGWTAVVIFAVFSGLALFPVNAVVAAVAAAVVLTVGVVVVVATAPRIAVAGGELRAGGAHIPLAVLGEVRELTAEQTRVELGTGLDARAYVCLRAGAHTAVRVEVVDAADPTPYWLVSTRHPSELAGAVARGREAAIGQG